MDHNEFDFLDDLVKPFKDFIRRLGDTGDKRIVTSKQLSSE